MTGDVREIAGGTFAREAQPAPRWTAIVSEHQVRCADGHHLPKSYALVGDSPMIIRCGHWLRAAQRECGRWTFLRFGSGRQLLTADVALSELRTMTAAELSSAQVIEWLGLGALLTEASRPAR
jgi:hypothetical protein